MLIKLYGHMTFNMRRLHAPSLDGLYNLHLSSNLKQ